MKSSKFTFATLALMLAMGSAAYAKGPMNGQADSAATGAGAPTRAGNAGAGTATRTQTRNNTQLQSEAQIRTRLQTMGADRAPGTVAP